MKLTLRLSLLLALVIAVVLLVFEGITLRRESELLEQDVRSDVQLVAGSLAALATVTVHRSGVPSELPLLLANAAAAQEEVNIAWHADAYPSGVGVPSDLAQRLAQGELVVAEVQRGQVTAVVAWAPVFDRAGLIGAVEVAESLAGRDAFVRRGVATAAAAILGVTVLAGLTALVAGRALVGRRVERLVEKARWVARGDLVQAVEVGGSDELSQLGEALNTMSADLLRLRRAAEEEVKARLEAEAALQHADRLRTVGLLAAGVAHELGTPLNVIAGRASLIERRAPDDERVVADARVVREQAARITRIVRLLMDFSRSSVPRVSRCDLVELARENVEMLAPEARRERVEIEVQAGGAVPADVDREQLNQVVTNLVMNGVQAAGAGGRVVVEVRTEGHEARLVVRDSGPGVPEADRERVFEAFFTTKPPGDGTGLGLSIVRRIVADHGGAVRVEVAPEGGAAVVVSLPVKEVP
jgi:two-component system NtrC family sensor kinase